MSSSSVGREDSGRKARQRWRNAFQAIRLSLRWLSAFSISKADSREDSIGEAARGNWMSAAKKIMQSRMVLDAMTVNEEMTTLISESERSRADLMKLNDRCAEMWARMQLQSKIITHITRTHYTYKRLHQALTAWVKSLGRVSETAASRKRKQEAQQKRTMKSLLLRLERQGMAKTWNAWKHTVSASRGAKQAVLWAEKAADAIGGALLRSAFSGWHESAFKQRVGRRAATAITGRLQNKALHMAWSTWSRFTIDARRRRDTCKRAVTRLVRRCETTAFDAWAAGTRMKQQHREQLARVVAKLARKGAFVY